MTAIAIIPARGGSKGLPRKNLIPLCGRPLIAWTIEAARAARTISRVIVSTDDAEIADVARRFQAEVVVRPADISGDTASSESALLHTLDQLNRTVTDQPQLMAFLQCTSPLMLPDDIDGTIDCLLNNQADSAFTAAPFHHFLWQSGSCGEAMALNHDKHTRQRRQEREPQYVETGAIYAMRVDGFLQAKHRFFGKTVLFPVPHERSLEIDDEHDLKLAEALLLERQQRLVASQLPDRIAALFLDFDGVLTDNRVLVTEEGREAVSCNRGDGFGIAAMKRQSIPVVVISQEANPVVAMRCRKLGVECIQGETDKRGALDRWCRQHNIDKADCIYVGNDVNDLACFEVVGCSVAVADAHPEARRAARFVLSRNGGAGAVRELTDLILHRLGGRNP